MNTPEPVPSVAGETTVDALTPCYDCGRGVAVTENCELLRRGPAIVGLRCEGCALARAELEAARSSVAGS